MPLSISFIAIILGIVEGLTEFLPVSSTGHLIVFDRLLGFQSLLQSPDKAELFEIVIQLGAILAIGVLYRKRLMESLVSKSLETKAGKLRTNLFIAFLPAAIVGVLTHKFITTYLFGPLTIAITLIVGGIIIIIIERSTSEETRTITVDSMTWKDALIIGLAQTLSLIPGTSR
ncbi:MAG TPA: undecaprenyl-diphosphate phosphatase, partial [Candidatus Kapabacteria bacterium]|nr:undecaprenyl-diphosphate phosphatase [Candidatus Kapabacteria bacterium]